MPLSGILPIALTLAVLLPASRESDAQAISSVAPSAAAAATGASQSDGTPPPKDLGAALTLKERLGAKWKDEQRVDNCKVPPEKRGSKPRPVGCDHPPAE